VKQCVLSREAAMEKVRREVQAFENFEKIPAARREMIPRDIQMFVWQRDQGKCAECGSKEGWSSTILFPWSRAARRRRGTFNFSVSPATAVRDARSEAASALSMSCRYVSLTSISEQARSDVFTALSNRPPTCSILLPRSSWSYPSPSIRRSPPPETYSHQRFSGLRSVKSRIDNSLFTPDRLSICPALSSSVRSISSCLPWTYHSLMPVSFGLFVQFTQVPSSLTCAMRSATLCQSWAVELPSGEARRRHTRVARCWFRRRTQRSIHRRPRATNDLGKERNVNGKTAMGALSDESEHLSPERKQ